jgi:hypothetical protein
MILTFVFGTGVGVANWREKFADLERGQKAIQEAIDARAKQGDGYVEATRIIDREQTEAITALKAAGERDAILHRDMLNQISAMSQSDAERDKLLARLVTLQEILGREVTGPQ